MGKITINEIHKSIFDYVQTISDDRLETKNKTIVGAINELISNNNNDTELNNLINEISNGKQLIANAIGEPLEATDTFDEMSSDINGLLSTFKTNMMNSGVMVESGDKFKQLIDKIKGLTEGEGNKGLQFASGTAKLSGKQNFKDVLSENVQFYTIDVNDLSFKPQIIIIHEMTDYEDNIVLYNELFNNDRVFMFFTRRDNITSGAIREIVAVNSCTITNTGFVLPVSCYSTSSNHEWLAIGVGEEDTTLRDSLASILQEEGVEVLEEDDMADLINKVDSEFDKRVHVEGANNIYAATSLPATGNTNDICVISSPLPNHIHIGRIKPTSVDENDIWLDTDGTDLSERPYRTITVGKLSINLRISSAYRLTSTGSYAAQVVAYYWDGSKWIVCCPTITTLKSTGSNSNGSISLGSSSRYNVESSGGISLAMQVKEGIQYTGKCTVRVNHSYNYGNSSNRFTYTISSYNKAGTQLYTTSKTTTLSDEGYYYIHNVTIPEPGGYIQVIGTSTGSNDEFNLYMNVTGNKA